MENEKTVNFDEFLKIKENRRVSRAKGKRTYTKEKIRNKKDKPRNMKNIEYNPELQNDEIYYEDRKHF